MSADNKQQVIGTLLFDEPMSKHTSWRIGGFADQFFTPHDIDDLALFVRQCPGDMPLMFLGLGSNLLVRDSGIRGVVISLKGSLSEIEKLEGNKIRVGTGASCAKVARFCQRNDLVGGEFFAGIPGLVGGALAMNAGAFGSETWSVVRSVVALNRQGELTVRTAKEYEVNYRSVRGCPDEWFVSAEFQFQLGDGEAAAKKVKELMEKRADTQPIGLPSCGSVFKNPDKDYAARLIEESGLKGCTIGGAVVSEKHANFIINDKNATATDVENLIGFIQKVVKEKMGIQLKTEVKIVGEASNE